MTERAGLVTIHGNPLTLVGEEIKVGALAPEVELLDNDLNPVKVGGTNVNIRCLGIQKTSVRIQNVDSGKEQELSLPVN